MNGAGSAEAVLSHDLPDGDGGIGSEVDTDHQGPRLAAASIRTGRIRCRGLGHSYCSRRGTPFK